MKTPSKRQLLIGLAVLLALFAVGGLAGRTLALPLPASVVGLALALLGLRLGVMAAAIEEPPGAPAPRSARNADAHGPRLRAANG